MANLNPRLYVPCLNPIELGACRLFFHGRPPLYFVTPVQPITDYFNSVPFGFTDRQKLWEDTFSFTRGVVEVFGVEFTVYFDPKFYWENWALYPPIAYDEEPDPCTILEYSLQ